MSGVGLWLAVGLLGGCGGLARVVLSELVSGRAGDRFPHGTLVVNLSGSVLVGLLAGCALAGDALLLAGTALLGSYTTFSAWMLESHRLGADSRWWPLAVNVLGSLVLGLAGVALGRAVGNVL